MLILVLFAACAASNPPAPVEPAVWQAPSVSSGPTGGIGPATDPVPVTEGASVAAALEPTQLRETPSPKPAVPPTEATDPIIAQIAGRPVHVSELLGQWLYADSNGVREQLDNLAVGRLVLAEASRLNVRVSPDLASEAYERGVKSIEKEIHARLPDRSLDWYVDNVLGLDPIRYRERLRDDALRSLLGERVVRAWLLQNEHAFVRVIAVRSEEDVKLVQDDLAAGKAFADVARERSKDESKKDGGKIAPIVKGDTPIGRMAFTTEAGAVGGPIAEGGTWLFVLVEKRGLPIEGDWSKISAAVEKSLSEQGVDRLEKGQWQRAMRERYTVDMSPFLKLVGQPAR